MSDEFNSDSSNRRRTLDSLDVVELIMAVEEAIDADMSLTPAQRQRLLDRIEARIQRGELGDMDDLDGDALGVLIQDNNADLIGSLAGKFEIRGDILSTGADASFTINCTIQLYDWQPAVAESNRCYDFRNA